MEDIKTIDILLTVGYIAIIILGYKLLDCDCDFKGFL